MTGLQQQQQQILWRIDLFICEHKDNTKPGTFPTG
jgi:hypothetical protein